MDSSIALAIMAKARRIFERESTFLAFPLSPIAYTTDQLDFFSETGSAMEKNRMMSEYSRLVNLIPSGVEWPPEEERYLWDIYDEILYGAKVASANRSAEEEADYQKAMDFLYETDENGLRVDSAAVQAYNLYRDAWFVAQENYNNKKVEAEFAEDAAAKGQWEDTDEPTLREAVVNAENEWSKKGFRTSVDNAKRTVEALGNRSPSKTWREWVDRFDKELDLKTDVDDFPYAASGFLPANAIDENSWSRFTLTKAEAKALVNEAPAALKSRLAPQTPDFDIESLSFEYSSARVTRAWLVPDVFKSRFWKFYDPAKKLSDGKETPEGICPAYVAGIVFARNIELKANERQSTSTNLTNHFQAMQSLSLGFANLAVMQSSQRNRSINMVTTKATLNQAMASRPKFNAEALATTRRKIEKPKPVVMSVRPDQATVRDHRSMSRVMVKRRPVVVANSSNYLITPRGETPSRAMGMSAGPKPLFTKRMNLNVLDHITGTRDSNKPEPTPPPPTNEIYVMAFICKRIPACPDPDPAFDWGGS
jgi:hypothetical protein